MPTTHGSQCSTDTSNPTAVTPSTSKPIKTDERKPRTAVLQILPKLPSNDSLSNSPGPASPGGPSFVEKTDNTPSDKSPDPKLTRKESYKAQRKNYRREKKRVANELLNSLKDPLVVVLADWLKIRGTLKSWTKLWCVLKPGLLLLYKSPKCKSNHWVGTILLNSCKVIERPSKKDGFCFKLYNPLDQSIWAPRGPENETIGAVVQPLPNSYSIFRAPSQASGMCWLDALEISLRNDSALIRSISTKSTCGSTSHETQWSEADYEKHFVHDLDDASQPDNGAQLSTGDGEMSDTESEISVKEEEIDEDPPETPYVPNEEEEFGDAGEQVEELADEHKSLIWYLVKQVRPGMDLSKVVLPTFILEPRSFLDKLTDSYYHVDILSNAVLEDDAFTRMKSVVKWYLSGLYKKPKGLKKPYNPILGETFRCYWVHPNESKTFYLAEQVSHHPPIMTDSLTWLDSWEKEVKDGKINKNEFLSSSTAEGLRITLMSTIELSKYLLLKCNFMYVLTAKFNQDRLEVSAFYVTNRQEGFSISASILAKSKFYGNSTSAILDGVAVLTLLPRGEDYILTIPYAHCKGILMGTLCMELGGKVYIDCEKTGYRTELDFKLKPFLGGADQINCISGRLKLGKETLATLEGYWDGVSTIKDRRTGEEQILWSPTSAERKTRLRRYTVSIEHQGEFESERLWQHVSAAITRDDMNTATEEKTNLEEAQRARSKERKAKCEEWFPKHFQQDLKTGQWVYKHSDLRPWDPRNDLYQYEHDYVIQTKTKHPAPMIRTASIVSVEPQPNETRTSTLKAGKRKVTTKQISSDADVNDSATTSEEFHSDSTHSVKKAPHLTATNSSIMLAIHDLEQSLQEHGEKINQLQRNLTYMLEQDRNMNRMHNYGEIFTIVLVIAILQALFLYYS